MVSYCIKGKNYIVRFKENYQWVYFVEMIDNRHEPVIADVRIIEFGIEERIIMVTRKELFEL